MAKFLTASRYMILLAVIGSLIGAVTILGLGVFEVVQEILRVGSDTYKLKHTAHAFIEITDVFLVGTVLFLVAVGLYELFIDDKVTLPRTLRIDSLEDLKKKMVGVIVLSISVLFLGQVADWDGSKPILKLGVATAAVIIALTWRPDFGPDKH